MPPARYERVRTNGYDAVHEHPTSSTAFTSDSGQEQRERGKRRLIGSLALLALAILFLCFLGGTGVRSMLQEPQLSIDPAMRGCSDTSLTTALPREKGVILILARNSDMKELMPTLVNFEQRFNRFFRYPYLLLNEEEFTEEFRSNIRDSLPANAAVQYDRVMPSEWNIPSHQNATHFRESFARQAKQGVQYAGLESYHNMCRFYSGTFARHRSLAPYDWYWRLEPGVTFYCDITYDPFRFMAIRRKVYGFVITIKESANTIPTLFRHVQNYRYAQHMTPSSLWPFVIEQGALTESYNRCHFWTNFEIGDLRFFRSVSYQNFFKALDDTGHFYTERWGDAPVRTLALALLAGREKVHYFEDFAYNHDFFTHCPRPKNLGCNCSCPPESSAHWDIDRNEQHSCVPQWRDVVKR
ncbi:glycosyltransferase family 15 protein [Mixia osmundae IAM 14324]|uniref:Glycosyltransferase family 15 protein n=1 Tax=Mixia osmundae (strain CBS 9802 / IAM 14324 / JCM 22182 / KY 12970) TaxID=764103 RepID=G7E443_MIXOS|nr:glycosyltransferase family 15 protein [Mixia osmundae IAM 14324]KEI39698.1 glycosyltransferase family 15 protein [Mixia osmundae IAM 14324]GAA97603.1 hypothetical protein E5Q_04281 [Mixia osmundae IAM 14324]